MEAKTACGGGFESWSQLLQWTVKNGDTEGLT